MATSRHNRLKRLHALSRLLDSSIPLPGGYRIGLDGFIGLIPGFGELAGGAASAYIIAEAARLGASTPTLLHMAFNVLLESIVGLVPFVGDLFDFVWKANEKNMTLLEKQLKTSEAKGSPEKRLESTALIIVLLLIVSICLLASVGFILLIQLIKAIQGGGG